MSKDKLVKCACVVFVLVVVGWAAAYIAVVADVRRADDPDLKQRTLSAWQGAFARANALYLTSVEKSVIPEGRIVYSDELTYTVVISASSGTLGAPVRFYDPLKDVTFKRFAEQPPGITYTQVISGGSRVGIISGTLAATSTSPVTVSFVAQMDAPGTLGWSIVVTNRACVYPFEGTLGGCVWSNEVSNVAYRPLSTLYLPVALKLLRVSGYYVDCVNGNDANSGTAPATAWRTLAPVHAADLVPGDVIHLKRGCTWSGGLVIDDSGEEGNPITFTTYGEGERPIITNPGNYTRGIEIKANYVVVEGVLVRDVHIDGVSVPRDYGHNVVRDCEITAAGSGITFRGHNNLAEGNDIHDLHMIVNTPGGDDDYGATAVKFSGPGNEAAYNRIEHCVAESYDYGPSGGGFELLGTSDDAYIHHNFVADTDAFLEVGMGSAKDVVIAYNVSVDNGRLSWLHLTGTFEGVIENMRIEHNTIVETGSVPHWVILGFKGTPNPGTLIFTNNIVYANDRWVISNSPNFTHEHNLYTLRGGTVLGFDLGPGEQIADPRFADLAGRNFRLRSNSPAIDAGADLGYTEDLTGNPVPVNDAPDMGAFEYPGVPERPPTPTPTLSPTLLPTPQPDEIIIDDVDPGFSTAFSQDAWQEYTYVGGQHYGDTHYYNREIGAGEDIATWCFTVPQPGRYEVYAWWWEGGWRPDDVPYTIDHLNGSTLVRVNQKIDGAQWNLLGTFEFEDQGSVMVSDDVSSGRDIVADAVRLVYLEPLAAAGNLSALSVTPNVTPVPSPMSFMLTSTPEPIYGPTYHVAVPTNVPAQMPAPTSRLGWPRIFALLTRLRQQGVSR